MQTSVFLPLVTLVLWDINISCLAYGTSFFFKRIILFLIRCAYECRHLRGQKRALEPLELEPQVVVNGPIVVLVTELCCFFFILKEQDVLQSHLSSPCYLLIYTPCLFTQNHLLNPGPDSATLC